MIPTENLEVVGREGHSGGGRTRLWIREASGNGSVHERSRASNTKDSSKFEDTNVLKINNAEMLEKAAKG